MSTTIDLNQYEETRHVDPRDVTIAQLRDELRVYCLTSEQAIYDAQQYDPALYLNTDRGVEDVMCRVLARLAEYEGANKRWHSFETVQAIAKERDALRAENVRLRAELNQTRQDVRALAQAGELLKAQVGAAIATMDDAIAAGDVVDVWDTALHLVRGES